MDRRLRSGIFVAALLTGLATAPVATAAPPPAPSTDGMLAAMQRDLGLTAEQAATRLATEKRANDTNLVLRKELRAAYAGGWLADGPSGADFDLYLQKWNGASWADVASATSPGPDETLTYNGTAGYYRYRVHAYSGSGTYALGYTRP